MGRSIISTFAPRDRREFAIWTASPLAQRSDDNAGRWARDCAAYEESTAPLIDFYRASGRLVEIDGELPVETVFRKVITIIDESRGRDVTEKLKSSMVIRKSRSEIDKMRRAGLIVG